MNETQTPIPPIHPVHKAEPDADGMPWCKHCNASVHVVPGGHGPTWVHSNTGAVAASGAPVG